MYIFLIYNELKNMFQSNLSLKLTLDSQALLENYIPPPKKNKLFLFFQEKFCATTRHVQKYDTIVTQRKPSVFDINIIAMP